MDETTEKPQLKGLAALNEKRRLEKLTGKGIREEQKAIKEEQSTTSEKKTMEQSLEKKETFVGMDELDFGIDPAKTYVFKTLVESKSPRHQMFSSRGKMFDGNRIRAIRYVPIAESIFVDEQGTRYDSYIDPILSFHNDVISVDGTDKRLVEFMLANDDYDENKHRLSRMPPRYTLVNKYDSEERMEAFFVAKKKALNAIDDSPIEELYPVSRVVFNIMDRDSVAVKNKLRAIAEKEPKKILDSIDSPRVKRGYVVQSSLDKGIIEVNISKYSLVWASSKTFIMEIKAIKDQGAQLNEITDFTFTDKGNSVYNILKEKIKD